MSADVVNINPAVSSMVKGESLKDMGGLSLQAMGVDLVIIRHKMAGAPAFLSNFLEARIINAGDGFMNIPHRLYWTF